MVSPARALGGAAAVLAASIFQYGHHTIAEVKAHLAARGLPIRDTHYAAKLAH